MFRAPPPERRRRGDLVAAALLVLVLVGAAVLLGRSSDIAGTTARTASRPITPPAPAAAAPAGFAETWRAPSAATATPLVSGPAVVTADGSTVTGRDAVTGEERWSYARDLPLCTAAAGFPGVENGRVLALYANEDGPAAPGGDGPYCSELTMLGAVTGARVSARNPDARPGTELLADDTYVLATGGEHLEVWRSDLVRTLEYGTVPAQEQVGRQPRPGCGYPSVTLADMRVAVIERCPAEDADRLTVLVTDGKDGAETPEERFSQLLPGTGAAVVGVAQDRVAVTVPGAADGGEGGEGGEGGRLVVFDGAGAQVAVTELDVAGPDPDPAGGYVPATGDDTRRYVFTGSAVLALDAGELALLWSFPDALGPPVRYGTDLLVPVPGGLAVLDPARGTPRRLIPVQRGDDTAPVLVATQGEVLLEQRGAEVIALSPTP
ncbi:PQQ-binding-like beta-propeller repeat protein [Pseudonocardia sp.]|uniref:Rv3212 family protein n=1 Tax=Pseudonocardia sp. TaxID=60912 RepID=UPI00260F886B|nr:PQQ-binding-like beta-propeller repeat protein [Pseudonocardia sp.]